MDEAAAAAAPAGNKLAATVGATGGFVAKGGRTVPVVAGMFDARFACAVLGAACSDVSTMVEVNPTFTVVTTGSDPSTSSVFSSIL